VSESGGGVTFHFKGLLTFVAFCVVLMIANNQQLAYLALSASVVLEVLLWRGVFGWDPIERERGEHKKENGEGEKRLFS
jgi:hypothetical protein